MEEPVNKVASPSKSAVIPAGLAITAIIFVAIDLRPGLVSIGPALPSIREAFRLSHGTAALLTSIPDVLMGLLALPTPWLARRFGRDRVMLLALLLLLASIGLRAFAQTVPSLMISTAGVGAGIAIAGTLIGGFIKAQFPTRLALVMGVYATALAVGSVAAAALTNPLAGNRPDGWRFATGIWSLLGVGAILFWSMVKVRTAGRNGATTAVANDVPLPLNKGIAWAITIFFGVNNLLFYAFLAWTVTIYRELGYSDVKADLILATFAVASLLGNPVFGILSRSRDRRGWLAGASILCCIGLAGLALAPLSAPYLWVSLIAFGQAGGFTLGMTLPLDNTDTVQETDVWNAFTLTFGYLIAATGPILVGILRDRTGSFRVPTLSLVGVGVFMLLLTAVLRPRMQSHT
ncbi:CynX/NimT family MFS transporter [Granulicella sp. L60]|uniref:MFS transporter n=1 Tax=Granulicella sp. L60 TaxID=1641866 RepID=UPI00131D1E11|nr:MFS transporter [Granulicella sp. L60]